MSSSSLLLCDLCVVLLFGQHFVVAEEQPSVYSIPALPDPFENLNDSGTDLNTYTILWKLPLGLCNNINKDVLLSVSVSPSNDGAKGNCSCGGFPEIKINVNDLPLLAQTPGLVVTCDVEGENTCKTLCNALATATKAKGPEVLCNRLKNANELKLSAFFKVCDHPWLYADMTAEEPLCCDENKVKLCPSMEKNNATEKVDAKTAV